VASGIIRENVLHEGAKMQINFPSDNENWKKWGALVKSWVDDPLKRPYDTSQLLTQMHAAGIDETQVTITGVTPDGPPRSIQFVPYSDTGYLYIPLPTKAMVDAAEARLHAIAQKAPGQRHYPLPEFYAVAFGPTATVVEMSENELMDFRLRRLGEYTINECM